jgi:hypothetical protein
MTLSSMLHIPHPLVTTAPSSITWCSLGGKLYFQAHIGTQSSTLPPPHALLPSLETSGKLVPWCKQDPWLLLLYG